LAGDEGLFGLHLDPKEDAQDAQDGDELVNSGCSSANGITDMSDPSSRTVHVVSKVLVNGEAKIFIDG
jgi:hypothetical protein